MIASFLDYKFLIVLAVIAFSRRFWPPKYYLPLGALGSALILGLSSPISLIVIGGITLLFLAPLPLFRGHVNGSPLFKSKTGFFLSIGIAALVVIFIVYKILRQYELPGLSGTGLQKSLLAVVGFSYFIFRAIDYLHIHLILKPQKSNIWELFYFVLFPSTITSGPIQKYRDFHAQAENPVPLSAAVLSQAGYRITRGFFRKIVIAVILYGFFDRLIKRPHFTGYFSLLTMILFLAYLYMDFAGYSDIAIGFGLLLGIRVPENFRKPFTATSITEFWRNWHITLVDWFRDHIFITFGGMSGSRLRAASLAFLVMILCGLWHGLTVSFLAWGVWHGANLFFEAILGVRPIPPSKRRGWKYWTRVVWTNARVAVGCLFFIPDSQAALRVLNGFLDWRIF